MFLHMPQSLRARRCATQLTHDERDWSIVQSGMATEVGGHPVVSHAPVDARPEREPGPALAARIRRRYTYSLLGANFAGAVLTFVLGNWVVPFPSEGSASG